MWPVAAAVWLQLVSLTPQPGTLRRSRPGPPESCMEGALCSWPTIASPAGYFVDGSDTLQHSAEALRRDETSCTRCPMEVATTYP